MESERVGTALIGYGYWGKNLARNFASNPLCHFRGLLDPSPESRKAFSDAYPHLDLYSDLDQLLADPNISAVLVATPPETHAGLVERALEAGKDVLVEKPMVLNSEDAIRLVELAETEGRVLMVDHTFMFHPAVRYLSERIRRGEFGDLLYVDSSRINLGLFQSGADVTWDLAPHDLSILDALTDGGVPDRVTAKGYNHFEYPSNYLCFLILEYANGFVAHIHLSWLAPVKVRSLILTGTKKMAIYDDTNPSEKVRVYDSGISLDIKDDMDLLVNYRSGDIHVPALPNHEALSVLAQEFMVAVRTREISVSDGRTGLRIVKILEAASESLAQGGATVSL